MFEICNLNHWYIVFMGAQGFAYPESLSVRPEMPIVVFYETGLCTYQWRIPQVICLPNPDPAPG
jgi:hypothetical protein